ncbi:MAG TPA: hypothetical protein VND64_13050 [Pirellulales bacterium]|nr:hypothetical protein [Pirellulales bacterium]
MRKKIAATVLSLLVAAYCTFGFMASFEGGADPSHVFKVGYAVVGVGGLVAAILYAIRKPSAG